MNGVKAKVFVSVFIIIATSLFLIYLNINVHTYNDSNISDSRLPVIQIEDPTYNTSILIFGDMMLDRNVRRIINKKGFESFFEGVRSLINDSDITVVNLEGPFTENDSLAINPQDKSLTFTFDPSLAKEMKNFGFTIAGLANNHTYNFGKKGLESTRKFLEEAGIDFYGDPFNLDQIYIIKEKNNIKIAIIGFHEFYNANFDKVDNAIMDLKGKVDFIIVTPHWGVEYKKEQGSGIKQKARRFIDLGADVVVGSHPHVIGEIEEYKTKMIYYSLGNFAFDQYFSEATMKGLGVRIMLEKHKNSVSAKYENYNLRVDHLGVRVVD